MVRRSVASGADDPLLLCPQRSITSIDRSNEWRDPMGRPDQLTGQTSVRTHHARRVATLGATIAVLALLVATAPWPGADAFSQVVIDFATPMAAAVATLGCFLAAHRGARATRLFWVLLTCATAAWSLAEATWSSYDLLGGPVPVPNWSDLGYLAAVPLAVAALLAHPWRHEPVLSRGRRVVDGCSVAAAVGLLGWLLVLGPGWHGSDLSRIGGLVTVAYPLTDVVLVVVVVLCLMRAGRAHRWELGWVAASMVAMSGSDAIYTYLTVHRSYQSGQLVDVGWVAAYLAIAVASAGADPLRRRGRHATTTALAVAPADVTSPSLVSVVAPYVPILVALSVVALRGASTAQDPVARWLALSLVLLVLVRNVLTWAGTQERRRTAVRAGA
jgi:diguanylate cyclase